LAISVFLKHWKLCSAERLVSRFGSNVEGGSVGGAAEVGKRRRDVVRNNTGIDSICVIRERCVVIFMAGFRCKMEIVCARTMKGDMCNASGSPYFQMVFVRVLYRASLVFGYRLCAG